MCVCTHTPYDKEDSVEKEIVVGVGLLEGIVTHTTQSGFNVRVLLSSSC